MVTGKLEMKSEMASGQTTTFIDKYEDTQNIDNKSFVRLGNYENKKVINFNA